MEDKDVPITNDLKWEFVGLSVKEKNLDPKELAEGERSLAREKADLENQKEKARLERYHNRTKSQERMGRHLMRAVMLWMCAVIVIVFLQGFGIVVLSDSVLITLLGSTSANVVGLFAIYAKWLFPKK
jgi:hypothetical protein